jgi:predicted transcriptional regulator
MSGNLFYPRSKNKIKKQDNSHTLKTAKQMERHLKGVANHWRIEILFLIAREQGINVEGVSNRLRCNFKTISEHTRRLAQAGLVEKKYKGRMVTHQLSPYGRTFVAFLTSFQHS